MALSVADRKYRLPHGSQKEIAADFAGGDQGYVSRAVAGEIHPKTPDAKLKLRRVQEAVALKLNLPVEEVFSSEELMVVAVSV